MYILIWRMYILRTHLAVPAALRLGSEGTTWTPLHPTTHVYCPAAQAWLLSTGAREAWEHSLFEFDAAQYPFRSRPRCAMLTSTHVRRPMLTPSVSGRRALHGGWSILVARKCCRRTHTRRLPCRTTRGATRQARTCTHRPHTKLWQPRIHSVHGFSGIAAHRHIQPPGRVSFALHHPPRHP